MPQYNYGRKHHANTKQNHYSQHNKQFLKDEFGVTEIALFGSYARNEARADSDVDILVRIPVVKGSSFENYYLLKEYLEKVFLKEVDLGEFQYVKAVAKEEIEKDIIYA